MAAAPSNTCDGPRGGQLAALAAFVLVCAVLGYAIGASGGADLGASRETGARSGAARGERLGARDGAAAASREGRRAGYRGAYGRAYVEAYRRGAFSVNPDSARRALYEAAVKCGTDKVPVGPAETCGP